MRFTPLPKLVFSSLTLSASCQASQLLRRQLFEEQNTGSKDTSTLLLEHHANHDVLDECPPVQQIVQFGTTNGLDMGVMYAEDMKILERRYSNYLGPGTFEEPVMETFQEGNFVLWGFEQRGSLHQTVYNEETRASGIDQVGPNQWAYDLPEDRDMNDVKQTFTYTGDHMVFVGPRFGVFGHIFADNIGYIAYMRDVAPPTTRFLLADTSKNEQLTKRILEALDPEFASRVDWIHCGDELHCNTLVRIRDGNLTVLRPRSRTRHVDLFLRARKWLLGQNPPPPESISQRTIVYYTRNAKGAFHGRAFDPADEELMLKMIQKYITTYYRPEKLVVFDGSGTTQEQIHLFQSANIVIGPHGSGLANLIFLLPAKTCATRPKLLELITSPLTPELHGGDINRSVKNMFSTAPWLEYHNLFLQPPSNNDVMFINMNEFELALQKLLSSEKPYTS